MCKRRGEEEEEEEEKKRKVKKEEENKEGEEEVQKEKGQETGGEGKRRIVGAGEGRRSRCGLGLVCADSAITALAGLFPSDFSPSVTSLAGGVVLHVSGRGNCWRGLM